MIKVGVFLSHEDAKIPSAGAYEGDVGFDIYAVKDYVIPAGTVCEVKTGVHLILPEGVFAQVNTRSSHGKAGCFVHHGVIDTGYTGEISVFFFNAAALVTETGMIKRSEVEIKKGDRIAQLLLHRTEPVKLEQMQLRPETERGENGFGSSGQ